MAEELESLFYKQHELSKLRKAIKAIEDDIESELAGILSKGITEQKGYSLVEKQRKTKEIDVELFKKNYPDIYARVVSIKKKDAEAEFKRLHPNSKNINAFFEPVTKETRTNIFYEVIKK